MTLEASVMIEAALQYNKNMILNDASRVVNQLLDFVANNAPRVMPSLTWSITLEV
jgi:hypothetical protein